MLINNCQKDLSSLFTWNTKQVFVYITATWPSTKPNTSSNKAIIWDAILPSALEPWHQNQYIHPIPDPALTSGKRRRRVSDARIYSDTDLPGKLRLKGQKPKYVITDHTGLIAGKQNVTLELGWNAQPWVGALMWKMPWNIGVWHTLPNNNPEAFGIPELKGVEKPKGMDTVRGAEGNRGKPA
jgi:signal peptidase complex subunit 3